MSTHHARRLVALAATLAFSCAAVAATPNADNSGASSAQATPAWALPVKTFARHARITTPRISPDGKHLLVSLTAPDGKDHSLIVYQLSDMKVISKLRLPINQLPLDPVWVSNQWIALEIGKQFGSLGKPHSTGQVIATKIGGHTQRYLFGWHKHFGNDLRSRQRHSDEAFGFIAGLPPVPDNHLYLYAEPWGRENLSVLYNIGVPHNSRHLLAQMHVGGMSFLVDPKGNAAYAFGTNVDLKYLAFRKVRGQWVKLDFDKVGDYFEPIAYAPDHEHVYVFVSKNGGPYSLLETALDGSHAKVLASNKFADASDIQWTAYPERPFAAAPEAGIPKPVFFNRNAPDSKLYRALRKAFHGEAINFINFTHNGDTLLFYVYSDRDPGTYYLINTKTFKVRKLFAAAPWIKPSQMATRWPFRFKADDGTELEGILTFPLHRKHENLPMVLIPHGGPFGVRDTWSFDWWSQMLANRGYLVLQVNYRGSSGRGEAFIKAGYRKWGTRIQQDLIDGVKWTIKHHFADPNRICVFGGSFGGYAAMMTVVRAPHMFKCAVGYDGVYNLNMLMDKGNVQMSKSGRNYLARVLGKTEAVRAANSPVNLVSKIDVPVFLAHGKDDHQAPYAAAKDMRDKLEDAHKTVEWLAFSHEGHGFYTEPHRAKFYSMLLAFLKKYIGPGVPPNQTVGK